MPQSEPVSPESTNAATSVPSSTFLGCTGLFSISSILLPTHCICGICCLSCRCVCSPGNYILFNCCRLPHGGSLDSIHLWKKASVSFRISWDIVDRRISVPFSFSHKLSIECMYPSGLSHDFGRYPLHWASLELFALPILLCLGVKHLPFGLRGWRQQPL